MEEEHERRQFLKLGASAGTGLALCCLCGVPCGRLLAADADSNSTDPYSMTMYCCLRCDQCDLYRQRQCPTCKWDPARGSCEVKRCAVTKGVTTCAHCADFPSCDKEFWKKNTAARKLAEALRSQLQAAK
jgi:hypothetical protein